MQIGVRATLPAGLNSAVILKRGSMPDVWGALSVQLHDASILYFIYLLGGFIFCLLQVQSPRPLLPPPPPRWMWGLTYVSTAYVFAVQSPRGLCGLVVGEETTESRTHVSWGRYPHSPCVSRSFLCSLLLRIPPTHSNN